MNYFVKLKMAYRTVVCQHHWKSDFESGTARCSVRVFERYSYVGDNRVSLNVTLFQNGSGPIQLSAIAAGGSQAMLFKINTWGEEAFLDKLKELL